MANLSFKQFTLGVEEEYMVIDPVSRELKSHEQRIVHEGQKVIMDKVKAEMHQAVVEVGTDICADVDEALMDVATLRKNHQRYRRRARTLDRRQRYSSFQSLGKPAHYRSCTLQRDRK